MFAKMITATGMTNMIPIATGLSLKALYESGDDGCMTEYRMTIETARAIAPAIHETVTLVFLDMVIFTLLSLFLWSNVEFHRTK
jgi:hypothetical protein